MGHELGFDKEAVHWVGVAIGESVMNAIKHGNRNDVAKHVFVEFDTVLLNGTAELRGCVRNQGQGFDPEAVADTLALENMHKSSGRGASSSSGTSWTMSGCRARRWAGWRSAG